MSLSSGFDIPKSSFGRKLSTDVVAADTDSASVVCCCGVSTFVEAAIQTQYQPSLPVTQSQTKVTEKLDETVKVHGLHETDGGT